MRLRAILMTYILNCTAKGRRKICIHSLDVNKSSEICRCVDPIYWYIIKALFSPYTFSFKYHIFKKLHSRFQRRLITSNFKIRILKIEKSKKKTRNNYSENTRTYSQADAVERGNTLHSPSERRTPTITLALISYSAYVTAANVSCTCKKMCPRRTSSILLIIFTSRRPLASHSVSEVETSKINHLGKQSRSIILSLLFFIPPLFFKFSLSMNDAFSNFIILIY